MSSLQLGLVVAGVVLVAVVIVYNVWQERRLKRSLAQAHAPAERIDARAAARAPDRVEPTLGTQRAAAAAATAPLGSARIFIRDNRKRTVALISSSVTVKTSWTKA